MALVSESLESLKRRLEAWRGVLELKELRVNVKKTKMMIRLFFYEGKAYEHNEGEIHLKKKHISRICPG